MERGKSGSGRGGKGKVSHFTQDLIALGSKGPTRVEPADTKRPVASHGKPSSSLGVTDRSREQGSSSIPPIIPAKKPKITGVSAILNRGVGGVPTPAIAPQPVGSEPWEIIANQVVLDPADLVPQVLRANDANQTDKVAGLLCSALKNVRSQRFKPDHCLILSLMYIAKIRPSVLAMEPVQQALCSLLKRDASQSLKNKNNPLVHIFVTGLMMRAFNDSKKWPDVFLKLYLDDALNDRVWVDMEECKGFVDNIATAFNTRQPPKNLLPQDMIGSAVSSSNTLMAGPPGSGIASSCSSPSSNQGEDERAEINKEDWGLSGVDVKEEFPVMPRYQHMQDAVEVIVTEFIKEHTNRRQPAENTTRNFLRLLSAACGIPEVRHIASNRLEMWLQNPKLWKPAQELLICICFNCNTHSAQDIEVMSNILKIRLKAKSHLTMYLSGIGEMIRAHPDNLGTLLKLTIYNELSSSRNPNNMPMLSSMFQAAPSDAPILLARVFQELLMNREDFHRPLRALLREVVRILRHDLDMTALCRELMSEARESTPAFQNFEFKERMYIAVVDLITLCIFLSISPAVKEAALAKNEKREATIYQNYQTQVAVIQRDAIRWHYDVVLRMYRPSNPEFIHGIYKVLFMEPAEVYSKVDFWPPDPERNTLMHLASDVPLLQNTLLRIFVIGLSKEHPLSPLETMDLADQLVERAASLPSEGLPMLEADKLSIIDLIFNLCAYRHPDNITLPTGYVPPQLAIINLYWKAWTMLLLLSAHNPSTFGELAWQKYPTLRALMEMCITNHFDYPPPLCPNPDELRAKELQSYALEKQQILEFESHLAAACTKVAINEATSLLLQQLLTMDPTGIMRRPPQPYLPHLRSLNQKFRLGHRLCRSRKPDFLLDIIQRQGTSHSMPWLADLVVNSEGALSHLPVQCLCEFLLSSTMEKQPKHQQLLAHLRRIVVDPKLDPQAPCEVLEYFLRRLSSTQMSSRSQAIKGLQLVLSPDDEAMDIDGSDREYSWLLRQLPQLPHFGIVRPHVVQALQQACQMENDPGLVAAYISFLSYHTQDDSLTQLTDLVVDMAQLIVERSTIMAALVPPSSYHDSETLHSLMQIFCSFLQKTREPRKEQYVWSESQDQILVTWSTGDESTMHILVVHAMVILLTYGPGLDSKLFDQLLEAWFPENKEYPKAYLVDTSEEALLIPDWLKLRMIRSTVNRLVEAALTDLEPPQLVLFIQSFGVPVESMSKLLHSLDQSVLLDEDAVANAVLDKNYMAQLVAVQHKRGATGGEVFVQVLQLHQQKIPDLPPEVGPISRAELPLAMPTLASRKLMAPEDVRPRLDEIFLSQSDQTYKISACKTLQRALSVELMHLKSDGIMVKMVADYFKAGLSSQVAAYLLASIISSPHLICPLLRIVCANEHVTKYSATTTENLLFCCQSLKQVDLPPHSPLKALVKNYVQLCTGIPSVNVRPPSRSSQAVVETVTLALLTQQPANKALINTGKLIDKLVAMEPELIGTCSDLQMQLLFGHSAATLSCRPYLLTLLTHRASWATLHHVVMRLLSSTQPEFDPTAVLDFLWALTSNPKLWQGREKNTPKHYVPENVLCLPDNQLLSMVGYIVEEASLDQGKQLESRLPQLLQCVQEDMQLVHKIVKHLLSVASASEKDSPKSKMVDELLLHLYFRIPGLIKYLMKIEIAPFLEKASVTEGGNSIMDRMSHLLFTALAATPQTSDWHKRSPEYELCARKMASVHPPLVLRQLPMLAASLRGRVHFDYSVFRHRNHLVLFQQTAGILELLQPYLFLKQHAAALHAIFDSYFALFKHHGHSKDVTTLLGRIVNLLQAYISRDGPRALQYLQTHALLLRDLQSRHPHLGSLCVLMSGVSLQRGVNCEVELEGGPEGTENGPVIVAVAPPPPPQDIDWRPLLHSLEQGEDLVATLQNLEHLSVRQPSILQWFVEPLCSLLLSPTGTVRSLSHTLIARYWRYDPAAAAGGVALRALTRCLDSNQPEVVATALDRIPDIILCVQEHAVPLLQKVFALGMCSSMNALQPLTKAVSLLNLQSGS